MVHVRVGGLYRRQNEVSRKAGRARTPLSMPLCNSFAPKYDATFARTLELRPKSEVEVMPWPRMNPMPPSPSRDSSRKKHISIKSRSKMPARQRKRSSLRSLRIASTKIKRPKIEINEENVDQAMQNLREQQGALVPVEDRGIEDKDYVIADVHVKADGNVVAHQHDTQLVSRPGRLSGIDVVDLDKQLRGAKGGETRTIKVQVPPTHPSEQIRGKEVEVEIAVKDVKRLELQEIDQDFLTELGFANEKELREALREQMVERISYDVKQSMREQVNKYLLENTPMDLPAKLSDRQAERVISRRMVDLMMRGTPREQIQANVDRLRYGARDEAIRELKLFFILQKIAGEQNVDVDEAELNGRIAMLAAQRGKRPEKLKQEMAKDGTLANLYVQMREQAAVDKLLETAQIEEVDLQTSPAEETAIAEQPSPSEEVKAEERKAPEAAEAEE